MDLYTVFSVDGISLPKMQAGNLEGVLGSKLTNQWDPTLDNEANKKFVADFKAKHGTYPSFYAAQAYDSIKTSICVKWSKMQMVNGQLKLSALFTQITLTHTQGIANCNKF